MPFAPMHELAEKYEKELVSPDFEYRPDLGISICSSYLDRTFELSAWSMMLHTDSHKLVNRIQYRTGNTVAALDQATPDTICVNLGGGYHHAGKYPDTGYAYSLINDIIWAVDYQLEQSKAVGIIDLDFHFGGGTYEHYQWNEHVQLYDQHHPKGELQKHMAWSYFGNRQTKLALFPVWDNMDKILLNIGTDWYKNDALFGRYGRMEADDLLNVWKATISQITQKNIPLAITMGGGYGPDVISLYDDLIQWLQQL